MQIATLRFLSLPVRDSLSQTTSKALPKESSHVLFMTDSPPGENSLPLSLPLEEMEGERERTRDGFRSEKFFREGGIFAEEFRWCV